MAAAVKQQRQHYETVAPSYVAGRQADAYATFFAIWAERLLAPWLERYTAEERRNHVVLDPMCGHANLAPFILRHTDSLILNDLSPSMLSYIDEEITRQARVLPASDAAHLAMEDAGADMVVVSGGLHHARATLGELLCELRRVLRPGGMLLFGEPSDEFLPIRLGRRLIYRLNPRFDHETEKAFRHEELRAALAQAGFEDVHIKPIGSIGYLLMAQVGVIPLLRNSRNRRLFRFLQAIDRVIEGNRLTRNTCVALTGHAMKYAER